jgi:hypothetical protein
MSADDRPIAELLAALCDETISSEEMRHLDRLLCTDASARRQYMAYLDLHARLSFQHGPESEGRAGSTDSTAWPSFPVLHPSSFVIPPLSPHPLAAPISFVGGAIFSYLVAALILGGGLLIGAFTHVSQPSHGLANLASPAESGAGGEGGERPTSPLHSVIGRITGMVDCRFAPDSKTKDLRPKTAILVGDEFILHSGLLEITYDTGARVILQGPVTYQIESPVGGYLSVGKLTARVETAKPQDQRPKTEDPHPSSFIPHPLFSVRTPIATVTDLGTEFGVEVLQEGRTRVHVLQGAVEMQSGGSGGVGRRLQRVAEGYAVEVVHQGDAPMTVTFTPQSFTRTMSAVAADATEAAYIHTVLADRPLAYWPLNEPIRQRKFRDWSGHGYDGFALNAVIAGQPGPFGDKSRALELDGNGYVDLGRQDAFVARDNFTVEAWLWIDNPLRHSTIFSAVGRDDGGTLGWSVCAYSAESLSPEESVGGIHMGFFAFHSQSQYPQATSFLRPGAGMPLREWTHVAVVYDRDQTAHLYRNGKRVESKHRDSPVRTGPAWLAIGWLADGHILSTDQYYWRGRLAHVAVYPQALGADRIRSHYLQQTRNTAGNGR